MALRTFVAFAVVINAVDYRTQGVSPWIVTILGVCGVCMTFGILTPYAGLSMLLVEVCLLRLVDHELFRHVTAIAGGAIVSVLGPGAYSIDSRIFGRKLLELPPKR